MINKYFRLLKEVEDLEREIRRKISAIEDETGKTIVKYFAGGELTVVGTHFSTSFITDVTWETNPLCTSNDTPDTLESAVERAEEMFKAKEEWKRLLVKIKEVLAE